MVEKTCFNCKSTNMIKIDTYKRYWWTCNECGDGSSEEKERYAFPFLKRKYLRKNNEIDFSNIYDYMLSEENVQQSINEFDNFKFRYSSFVDIYLKPNRKMNILDISGGNGHFLNKFKSKGNNLVLTEINQKAIDYAKEHLDMKAIYYDVNEHTLEKELQNNQINVKFDLIMVRACSMFVKDLGAFIKGLRQILSDQGTIILSGNILPTLGILMRTQFDDFSFFFLRQPQTLKKEFLANGLKIIEMDWAPDLYDYYLTYYDRDLIGYAISSYYQLKAILKLRKKALEGSEKFSFRRRDRQIHYIIAKHPL